jgi:CRISPR/Cas system CMR-associated protein Cmr3 (group 5 of RAMP superfamily)
MKIIYFILFYFISPASLQAQQISGKVQTLGTRDAVAGVTIVNLETGEKLFLYLTEFFNNKGGTIEIASSGMKRYK